MASKPVGFAELVFENANVAESWKRWKWQRMQLMLPSPLAEKDENQLCGYFLLQVGQVGLQRYILPRYVTYLDTVVTIRYMILYIIHTVKKSQKKH